MFKARVCLKVQGETSEYICNFEMLKKFIPNLVEARVLVESGDSETRGSTKMTLRVWGKPLMRNGVLQNNRYCARYIPLMSTPTSK